MHHIALFPAKPESVDVLGVLLRQLLQCSFAVPYVQLSVHASQLPRAFVQVQASSFNKLPLENLKNTNTLALQTAHVNLYLSIFLLPEILIIIHPVI